MKHPGLAALKSLEGRTIDRVGCVGTTGDDGDAAILSFTIVCSDEHRVHVTRAERGMPWLAVTTENG